MDPRGVARYVARVRQRHRVLRRAGLIVVTVTVASVAGISVVGADLECGYVVAREGAPLPTLTGLTYEQARQRLHRCLPLEIVGERPSDVAAPGVIIEQHPNLATTGKVVNDRRAVQVVVSAGGHAVDRP